METTEVVADEQKQQLQSLKSQVFGSTPPGNAAQSQPSTSPEESDGSQSQSQTSNTPQASPSQEGSGGDSSSESNIQTSPQPAFDAATYLKETFGVDSADAIKQQIARIQELEQRASTPAEYAFANEQAKLLANAINSGDFKPVKEFVDTQLMLSNIDGMTDEQKLKLKIKMENPRFTDAMIDEEFRDLYELDEENVDESRLERERLKMQQKRENDALAATSLFAEKRQKISLPNIPVQKADDDPAYVAWKTSQDQLVANQAANSEAYGRLTPKDISHSIQYNDEAAKLKIDFAFEPDAQSFSDTQSLLTDDAKVLAAFAGQDGSPDRIRFAKALHYGMNIDKILNSAMTHAVNQTKLWFLQNQKNIGDNVVRNFQLQEPTAIDKVKQAVFG